ncbi:acylphosphatase [Bacillus altitudinis]|nr:acylphosphatase [Bacillus pumilus]MDM5319132.1 acylphosphatase [Bacillus pumilus]MDR4994226.1 acylphosphatase [Bacillus altitudinis]
MTLIHYHAIFTGRVQGVGFRYFVQGEAFNRGMKGWVRNTDEGHVELKVEGEQQEVLDFLKTVRKGSPFSKVTDMQMEPLTELAHYQDFRIKG